MTGLSEPEIGAVVAYFEALQATICEAVSTFDGHAGFSLEEILPETGGKSRPRVLAEGVHIEKAAVQFTHSIGSGGSDLNDLPSAEPACSHDACQSTVFPGGCLILVLWGRVRSHPLLPDDGRCASLAPDSKGCSRAFW